MKISITNKLKSYANKKSKDKILIYLSKDACCGFAVPKFFARFVKDDIDLKVDVVDGIKVFYEPYIENFLGEKDVSLDLVGLLNVIIVNY